MRSVIAEGVSEIWLSSEDTGAYGLDIGTNVAEMLRQVVSVMPTDNSVMLRVGMTNPPYILAHLDAIAGDCLCALMWARGVDIVSAFVLRTFFCRDSEASECVRVPPRASAGREQQRAGGHEPRVHNRGVPARGRRAVAKSA